MAGLKTNKPLMGGATLKGKTTLKAKVVPKKQATPTITLLRRRADKLFSRYVRLRDSEPGEGGWYGTCITHNKHARVAWKDETGKLRFDRDWDAGHFVSRGNLAVRYEEENVNLQCKYYCNNMKSGNRDKYRVALRLKYGDGVPEKLEKMADDDPSHHFTREELEQVIADAKEGLRHYESLGF